MQDITHYYYHQKRQHHLGSSSSIFWMRTLHFYLEEYQCFLHYPALLADSRAIPSYEENVS